MLLVLVNNSFDWADLNNKYSIDNFYLKLVFD